MEQADRDDAPAGSATSPLKPYAGDIVAIAKWVERNRPVLDATREGLKQDVYCMPLCIGDESGAPQVPVSFLTGLRQIARDFTDAGFVEAVKDNPDRAASYYLEPIRFGKKFHNASVIESLVGVAVQFIGQKSLDSLVANATLSDETLRGVIVACREGEVGQDAPARIWATELAHHEAVATQAKASWRDNPKTLPYIRYVKALKDFSARKPLDDLLQKKVVEAALKNELKGLADEWKERFPRPFREFGRTNVHLRATQIRAAIALYQKANGRLPDSLDALCPDILPSVPIDPFSGKPMRYAKTADGWKIWSVGPDNVDHGGNAFVMEVQRVADNIENHNYLAADIVYTAQVQSNIERRSYDFTKDLPAQAQQPANPSAAGI